MGMNLCVYLVNEFKTSKLCNCCHHELAPFLIRESDKPKDIAKNKLITVNGLLSHTEDITFSYRGHAHLQANS